VFNKQIEIHGTQFSKKKINAVRYVIKPEDTIESNRHNSKKE